jgi:hypothetical protein
VELLDAKIGVQPCDNSFGRVSRRLRQLLQPNMIRNSRDEYGHPAHLSRPTLSPTIVEGEATGSKGVDVGVLIWHRGSMRTVDGPPPES